MENNVYLQRLNAITIYVIFVYAMPIAGTKTSNVLNASSAKLQLPLLVRGLERRMPVQNVVLKIHFPVRNVCASKEKNVFNIYVLKFV